MRIWIAYSWVGLLLLLTLVSLPSCSHTAEGGWFNMRGLQSALDPQGPVAANQAYIFYITLAVTAFLFITVGGALAFVLWRYRLRRGDDPDVVPPQAHGHPLIELALVLGSTVLLVIIAVPTFSGILLNKRLPERYADDAVVINVTGYQWWWGFEYPEYGFHTANEMVFPAGRAVRLYLRANDVIHSFWLPKLAGKTDLIPGQENFMWIKADAPGEFWGQCAEFCGDAHAYMLFRARAVPEDAWRAWLARQQAPAAPPPTAASAPATAPEVLRGAQLFGEHCLRCHSIDNRVQTMGPNLARFADRSTIAAGWLENEPAELARWLREPDRIKPGNLMWRGFPDPNNPRAVLMPGIDGAGLGEDDIAALVAYLYTLR